MTERLSPESAQDFSTFDEFVEKGKEANPATISVFLVAKRFGPLSRLNLGSLKWSAIEYEFEESGKKERFTEDFCKCLEFEHEQGNSAALVMTAGVRIYEMQNSLPSTEFKEEIRGNIGKDKSYIELGMLMRIQEIARSQTVRTNPGVFNPYPKQASRKIE